jgi:hypothetical protein
MSAATRVSRLLSASCTQTRDEQAHAASEPEASEKVVRMHLCRDTTQSVSSGGVMLNVLLGPSCLHMSCHTTCARSDVARDAPGRNDGKW